MRVTKLSLRNFKSFRDVTIPFRPFNVVVGANASGKSNLVQAFQFLKDIADHGLENAVSLQGGVEFLRNMEADSGKSVKFLVEFEYSDNLPSSLRGFFISPEHLAETIRSEYTLELKFHAPDSNLEVVSEELRQKVRILEMAFETKFPSVAEGYTTLSYRCGRGKFDADGDVIRFLEPGNLRFMEDMGLTSGDCLLNMPVSRAFMGSPMNGISIYDMDTRLPKIGTPRAGKADLESDGGNLAIVVKDILRDKEKSRKFHNLVGYLLPHVKGVSVEEFGFNSLMMNFQESYAPGRNIPATFISDGTIGMTAALVAFAFEGNDVTILEEPDRNVHPRLISGLTTLMKDVSRRSQILVTTHNPEFVRLGGIENLILVHRDKEGFSRVSCPADSEIVKIFLSEEIGIDDLHVDGFLEFSA